MIDLGILRVLSGSVDGMSAVEVAGRIEPSLVGHGVSAVRCVSSALVSMANRGLLIRHAGHKARYSVTDRGRRSLSELGPASGSLVDPRGGGSCGR